MHHSTNSLTRLLIPLFTIYRHRFRANTHTQKKHFSIYTSKLSVFCLIDIFLWYPKVIMSRAIKDMATLLNAGTYMFTALSSTGDRRCKLISELRVNMICTSIITSCLCVMVTICSPTQNTQFYGKRSCMAWYDKEKIKCKSYNAFK